MSNRRGKAINVKIATSKVIKALETKHAELKKQQKEQATKEKAYEKAVADRNKKIIELATAKISKAENFRVSERSWQNVVNIDFDIPKSLITIPDEIKRDHVVWHEHQYTEAFEELENAIRILKMTDEEVVSTSTYQAVARYL